jgi:hypothetical protein
MQITIKQNGPWGGVGDFHYITVVPQRLVSVTVRSDTVLHAISFTYVDENGEIHSSGLWGGSGGIEQETVI